MLALNLVLYSRLWCWETAVPSAAREAFPNAFLGVLMPEDELLPAPSFKRGRRFDWFYERMVKTGRLESLLSENLDLPDGSLAV
jgi:hypothetical protein